MDEMGGKLAPLLEAQRELMERMGKAKISPTADARPSEVSLFAEPSTVSVFSSGSPRA